MLKEGDTVSLGCNPTIKLGDSYTFLKPYVVIRRTLSDDVPGDLQEMQVEVRKQLFRSLRTELEVMSDTYAALGKEVDMDALATMCEKEIGDVEGQTTFTVHEGQEKPPPVKAKPKKGVHKLAKKLKGKKAPVG